MTGEEAVYIMLADGGGGGGGKDPLFHYILDNSTNWIDLPIDNKFKYTASLLHSDRTEFYNMDLIPFMWNSASDIDTDGTIPKSPVRLEDQIMVFITAWEYDTPLYSYMAAMSRWDKCDYFSVDVGCKFDEEGNRVYEYLVGEDGYYILDEHGHRIPNPDYESAIERDFWFIGLTQEASNIRWTESESEFSFIFDNRNFFKHQIKLPASQWTIISPHYEAIQRTPETEGKPDLFPTQKYLHHVDTYTMSATNHGYTFLSYPTFRGTYSDMSTQEVADKYNEIVDALYASRNIDTRNALLDLEIAPNPFEGT